MSADSPSTGSLATPLIGGWQIESRAPHASVADLVREACWYAMADLGPQRHEHLPTARSTIIINLSGPFHTEDGGGQPITIGECEGFVAGLHTTPASTAIEGDNRGLEIELSPMGAHLLLGGLPMEELREESLSLDVLGPGVRRLLQRLGEPSTRADKLDLVSSFLVDTLADTRRDPHFVYAWNRLSASGGSLRVRELARDLGWSEKRLARAFRRFTGLTPKEAARLMRFERAVAMAQTGPPRWADIAFACGFHDQAHLVKEIRAFAGATPSELLRRLRTGDGPATAEDGAETASAA